MTQSPAPVDFGPVSPDGSKPAPTGFDLNTAISTNPILAGYVASGTKQPTANTDVSAAPSGDLYASTFDWSVGGGAAIPLHFPEGGGTKSFTVPAGYVGWATLSVGDDPGSKGSGYEVTLNGTYPYTAAVGNNEVTHRLYFGVEPPNNGDPRAVVAQPGTFSYSVKCVGTAVAALRHYP